LSPKVMYLFVTPYITCKPSFDSTKERSLPAFLETQ
jgi:hypothetical protein